MALRYTVLAFLPVAYIHDLARSRFLVLALNLHGNNKGQPIDSTAHMKGEMQMKNNVLVSVFPGIILPLSLWTF